jgi:acetyltransferase-like isoleucine patch superfamily enzyme
MIARKGKIFFSIFRGFLKRKFSRSIGAKSFIGDGVQILGLDNVRIGEYCTIGANTLITINNRLDNSIKLDIRDNVYVGRFNFFTVGNYVVIKEFCIIGNNCAFLCSNHIINDPLVPYALSGASDSMSIVLGVNCWLGHNVSVVGDVTIGHGSVIGANSVVVTSIPPFSIAVGNPARVIKRYNFRVGVWERTQDMEYSEYLNEDVYLNHIIAQNYQVPIAFHSSSTKFGDV